VKVARVAAFFGLALAMWPRPVKAHLVETGLGPVYDGVAHFVLSPEDFIPVVGAALLAGLGGKAQARLAIFVLPLAWLLGDALGGILAAPAFVAPLWAPFMIIGGLVAADLRLPFGATTVFIGALGFILGYSNGFAMTEYGSGLRGMLGSTITIFVVITLVAALAAGSASGSIRIAWRVVGSWIAASGLLLLGWALH
jgi:hypothetical protein